MASTSKISVLMVGAGEYNCGFVPSNKIGAGEVNISSQIDWRNTLSMNRYFILMQHRIRRLVSLLSFYSTCADGQGWANFACRRGRDTHAGSEGNDAREDW